MRMRTGVGVTREAQTPGVKQAHFQWLQRATLGFSRREQAVVRRKRDSLQKVRCEKEAKKF